MARLPWLPFELPLEMLENYFHSSIYLYIYNGLGRFVIFICKRKLCVIIRIISVITHNINLFYGALFSFQLFNYLFLKQIFMIPKGVQLIEVPLYILKL